MIEVDQLGVPQSAAYAERWLRFPSTAGLQVASELHDSDYLTLSRTIEADVVPRLLRAHRADPRPHHDRVGDSIDAATIHRFATLIVHSGDEDIRRFVVAALASGQTHEDLCLDLLAPTAVHLGDLWRADTCSFTDVTLGVIKLQSVLRDLDQGVRNISARSGTDAILLATVPGSQHIFGLLMVEAFFRRAGWIVGSLPGATPRDIVRAVRSQWYAAIGLSMSSDAYADQLPKLIATLRRGSRNRSIMVFVGGAFFNANPAQVARVGADATACDARDAVVQAKRLLTAVARN